VVVDSGPPSLAIQVDREPEKAWLLKQSHNHWDGYLSSKTVAGRIGDGTIALGWICRAVLNEGVMSIVDGEVEQMRGLCFRHGVKELYVFGSALREDFGPDSDVDPGVVFSRNGIAGSFDQYFDFESELEHLLGRPVDLVCLGSIRNSVFRRELDETKRLIHAA
jgi:predicted nucleotidyltransferase